MKPLFLDCPPRYTRTQRQSANDVDYACAVERGRETDYSQAWWAAMLIIAVVAAVVIAAFGAAP